MSFFKNFPSKYSALLVELKRNSIPLESNVLAISKRFIFRVPLSSILAVNSANNGNSVGDKASPTGILPEQEITSSISRLRVARCIFEIKISLIFGVKLIAEVKSLSKKSSLENVSLK